jgi:type VI secretion system protein ImpA
MTDLEPDERKVAGWQTSLPDDAAPCGPDLEYDNDFLALVQAATGKPESTFGPAEPPDWRAVVEQSEALLDRSRDLRIAVLWLRGKLHTAGYASLAVGLRLINGLLEQHWDHLHPLPDPDDGDLYARVNTLSALPQAEGLMGDLREAWLVQDRAIGELTVRSAQVALGQLQAAEGEAGPGKDQISAMLGALAERDPGLRARCQDAVVLVRQLIALANDKLGSSAAPDLRALYNLAHGIASLLPAEDGDAAPAAADDDDGASRAGGGTAGAGRSLSGSIHSREDAIRAIDMVCTYLERAEPTNPAPLFLRRARQLIGQNFLQLIKALAPDALPGVAGMVGVNPDAIESPDSY